MFSEQINYEESKVKSISAQCGHVKRRLNNGEPLEGKTLEFALGLVDVDEDNPDSEFANFCRGIADKLKSGEQLDDYEEHIFVDVILLHAKLGSGNPIT